MALDFVYDFLYTNEQSKTLDFIMTDSNMPIMNGIQMIKEIQKMIQTYIQT